MTTQKKIKLILSQADYEIRNGVVFRYYKYGGYWREVQVSKGQICLIEEGGVPEMFLWDEVELVINKK